MTRPRSDTDRHAPLATLPAADRNGAWQCCTPESLPGGRWEHDRVCLFRSHNLLAGNGYRSIHGGKPQAPVCQ